MAVDPKEFKLTLAQAAALHKVFGRCPLVLDPSSNGGPVGEPLNGADPLKRMSFEDFINLAEPTIGMDDAITIRWCGMWLAIEKDGYTHS